jgi:hypothetical protein
MPVSLEDGYTVEGRTKEKDKDGDALPVLVFTYRPAMPDAIYRFEYATTFAKSGTDQLDATANFVAEHVTAWDASTSGKPAALTAANIRRLPMAVLQDVVRILLKWAGQPMGQAAGNLPGA